MNQQLKDILLFRWMLTPILIQLIFWAGLILTVVSGIWSMFTVGFLNGLIMLIFGPITLRLGCELLIVIFQIHENLIEIKNKK
jgi:hypothetical protein